MKPKFYRKQKRTETDNSDIKVDSLTFGRVDQFMYLGVNINNANVRHDGIRDRLASANRCFFSFLKLLKSKNLSYESKKILYTSYIRLILKYM